MTTSSLTIGRWSSLLRFGSPAFGGTGKPALNNLKLETDSASRREGFELYWF
jgi:hypothetical protein